MTEAAANRGKAATLGVLSLALLYSLCPLLLSTAAGTAGRYLGTSPPISPPDESRPLWLSAEAAASAVARPVGLDERTRDPFSVDESLFPPPLLFADEPVATTKPKPKSAPIPAGPVEIEPVVEATPDAPDIALQGTTSGRVAILAGRVIRRGDSFRVGPDRYQLISVGEGWVLISDSEGRYHRLAVARSFGSPQATGRPSSRTK